MGLAPTSLRGENDWINTTFYHVAGVSKMVNVREVLILKRIRSFNLFHMRELFLKIW